MKKVLKRIKMQENDVNYIQALYEDYRAKQDLITMIFELHKFDETDTILCSVPFKSYEKQFAMAKVAYDEGMKIIQEKYITEEYQNSTYQFEINFNEKEMEITTIQ